MTSTAATSTDLLPRPRRVRRLPGEYHLRQATSIYCTDRQDGPARRAACVLRDRVARDAGLTWNIRVGNRGAPPGSVIIEQVDATGQRRGDQWYSLRIKPGGVLLRGAGAAGLYYGALTLGQLIASGHRSIRAMDIEDWPDFAARGVMLDISRDKVPTLSTLKRLVDLLAGWKINQLQLYTEHTFAYAGHECVWRGASPMTGGQIRQLDRYCRRRGVELVPNQNSFGHMERWLRHEPYAGLAETLGRWRTPWGEYRDTPSTLNPLDPGSVRLVSSLYDQLLPHFSSRLLNVGCDETFELGQGRSRRACQRRGVGRVYLDFLLKIHRHVRRRSQRMMFWADIARQHPALIAKLPRDVIPLIWGYEADHPFDEPCSRIAGQGLDFYVCGGTSSWCSFGGRTRNCLANLRNAAASGRRHGAAGYLITDWGDFGHRQYLPASYCGFLYGAAVSWCGRTNASIDVADELSRHAFDDPSGTSGQLWYDLGTVHELCAPRRPNRLETVCGPRALDGGAMRNRTVLFACMQAALGDSHLCGTGFQPVEFTANHVERMERRVAELAARAAKARFGGPDGGLVRRELRATLAVLRHACRRARVMLALRNGHGASRRRGGIRESFDPLIRRECRSLAADMVRIMERHRELWMARNRRGGLASSLAYYRRNLREYQAILSGRPVDAHPSGE